MSASSTKMKASQNEVSRTPDSSHNQTVIRRRSKIIAEKKLADDEFMAAATGDVEWLKQSLKDAGSVINYDKNGLAAIHLAAIHGRLDCLNLCIEKFKTDINLPSSTGWRAVHLCMTNQTGKRSLQCLAYLIEQGANCSVANDDGITPVHQAASEGHEQCLKLLLEVNAKFDSNDCRGNTPLDLAKLWGHRKCARILSAEIWHHDKDYFVKEMQQLKKVKMHQVLREFEEEEKIKDIRQIYGDKAFKEWMTNKHLAEKPAEQAGKENIESSKESLYKANSVSRASKGTEQQETTKIQRPVNERHLPNEMMSKITDEMADDKLVAENDRENDEKSRLVKSVKWKQNSTIHHKSHWNIAIKAVQNQYVPNLDDNFPRDEYTLMPQVKGAPKFYEGKFVHLLTPDSIDKDIKKKGSAVKLRRPQLPEEVINSILSKDSSVNDRGMIFKCKHIEDVHTKKKFDIDKRGRSEAPLHLTNDISSFLVQNSVRIGYKTPSSSKTDRNSEYTNSEWTEDNFPLPAVMQAFKNMTRPKHFLNNHDTKC